MAGYYKENSVHMRATGAEWRKKNPGRVKNTHGEYYQRNTEVARKDCLKRRVLKLALPYVEHVTPMPADGRCPHCRVAMTGKTRKGKSDPNAPVPDHIVPLSKGGHHVPENTTMICDGCNRIKGNRSLSYLLNRIRLKSAQAGIGPDAAPEPGDGS